MRRYLSDYSMNSTDTPEMDGLGRGDGIGCFDGLKVRFMSTITEAAAFAIVRTTLEAARKDGGSPISVGVVDSAGELVAFCRDDDAPVRSIKLAIMKAYTSARFRKTTLALQRTLEVSGRPLVEYGDGMFTALAGGIPLEAEDELVGGMGVSGRLPKDDHELALLVVERLKLISDENFKAHSYKIGDQLEGGNLR